MARKQALSKQRNSTAKKPAKKSRKPPVMGDDGAADTRT